MSKNNLNMVVDFNNLLYRSLFVCSYDSAYNVSNFDTDEECNVLVRKVALDMSYVIRSFAPDRVIVACDSKHPWRRSIYKDIEGMEYKGNRVKDEEKNWKNIYAAIDEFKKVLSNNGFIISEVDTAEADDLAAMWKKRIMDNGESVIFVTSDKDWSQLLEFRDGGKFAVAFNPISNNKGMKKFSVPPGFQQWLADDGEKTDIFFGGYDPVKGKMRDSISKSGKILVEDVIPDDVLMEKIVCGDDGDNVPGFWEFYKNGKKWRMTELRMRKCMEASNILCMKQLNESTVERFAEEIGNLAKHPVDDIDPKARLARQRSLVELNPDLFPDKIRSDFDKSASKYDGKGFVNSVNMKMEEMLAGSKFIDKDYKKVKDNSIFKELDGLDHLITRNTGGLF